MTHSVTLSPQQFERERASWQYRTANGTVLPSAAILANAAGERMTGFDGREHVHIEGIWQERGGYKLQPLQATESTWTDDERGAGLLASPYCAVNGNDVYLWVNGVVWEKDCFFESDHGGTALEVAYRTGLPVFKARLDWRRSTPFKWELEEAHRER